MACSKCQWRYIRLSSIAWLRIPKASVDELRPTLPEGVGGLEPFFGAIEGPFTHFNG